MKIVLPGGSGQVGTILARAFTAEGDEVVVLSRKPAPAMILDACERLDVDPERCTVIGDIGSDVGAAEAAGAVGVLVPTPHTAPEEVAHAREVHSDLMSAVEAVLRGTADLRAGRTIVQVLR